MARPWLPEAVPLLVVVLIAAHVLALVYWIYRVAIEKPPQRRRSISYVSRCAYVAVLITDASSFTMPANRERTLQMSNRERQSDK